MLIFKDIFSGDEMFSDTYKYKLIDGVLYEVYGKLITRKLGDVELDGANPSAEEACEGTEEAVESGVDVVLNHRLMETYAFPDKKSFTLYLKEYMKRLVDKMVENGSTEVDVFKTNINKVSARPNRGWEGRGRARRNGFFEISFGARWLSLMIIFLLVCFIVLAITVGIKLKYIISRDPREYTKKIFTQFQFLL